MKRKIRKSNAGLYLGLAFGAIFGILFGYLFAKHADTPPVPTPPAVSKKEPVKPIKPTEPVLQSSPIKPAEGKGEIITVKSDSMLALTFDAGASAAPVPDLLETLARHDLHVTFFLTGQWCKQNPDMVKKIFESGHEIGNHTYSHRDLCKLSAEQIEKELEQTARLIREQTGSDPAPLARCPFGSRDQRVLKEVRQQGYVPIYWSLDSHDSVKKDITAEEIESRVARAGAGDIVLMHCGSNATAKALEGILDSIEKKGLRVVTVSKLIASEGI